MILQVGCRPFLGDCVVRKVSKNAVSHVSVVPRLAMEETCETITGRLSRLLLGTCLSTSCNPFHPQWVCPAEGMVA